MGPWIVSLLIVTEGDETTILQGFAIMLVIFSPINCLFLPKLSCRRGSHLQDSIVSHSASWSACQFIRRSSYCLSNNLFELLVTCKTMMKTRRYFRVKAVKTDNHFRFVSFWRILKSYDIYLFSYSTLLLF